MMKPVTLFMTLIMLALTAIPVTLQVLGPRTPPSITMTWRTMQPMSRPFVANALGLALAAWYTSPQSFSHEDIL